jgi:hypothetical protein
VRVIQTRYGKAYEPGEFIEEKGEVYKVLTCASVVHTAFIRIWKINMMKAEPEEAAVFRIMGI